MTEEEALLELLLSGNSDWVSLDEVVWAGTDYDLSPSTKEKTLRILDRLFRERLMVPGELAESGFEDWTGSAEEWLVRSHSELERLEWRPMAAGFWFRLTDHGRAYLEQSSKRGDRAE